MSLYLNRLFSFINSQISAAIFAALIILAFIASKFLWDSEVSNHWVLTRYDCLFIFVLFIQFLFIIYKIETLEEARVICVFHIIGTIMEIFKTHIGSWEYPELSFFRIAGVPLFSGFMYSSIGSYIARCWRIYDFQLLNFPSSKWNISLCIAIYFNFFLHHFGPDIRIVLFATTLFLYRNSCVSLLNPLRTKSEPQRINVPLLLIWLSFAFIIYAAENICTYARIWVYPYQKDIWHMVSIQKMGSWYLLMIISFMLVYLVHYKKIIYVNKYKVIK